MLQVQYSVRFTLSGAFFASRPVGGAGDGAPFRTAARRLIPIPHIVRREIVLPGEQGAGAVAEVTVVRYPNRRLYDRSQARYVTLPEVTAMVRRGTSVTVRDSKTGEDLTAQVLTQIILEHHPERMELFPVPLLHLMIGANDAALGFLREYLRQALHYLELWQRMAPLRPMGMPLEWMRAFLPAAPASSPGTGQAGAADPLAQRLAEVERRLSALDGSPPRAGGGAEHGASRRSRGRARRKGNG
jgi:polyhydroxyalkanoate synthesis repressor PhaR